MKGVLISIRKPHTDNIKALIKTIEVRKTKPRIERPFPAFIYEAKANGGCGKVIGEFVCRGMMDGGSPLLPKQSCLTLEEIFEYSQGKPIYGWRIADLKIYDKPKELSEFYCAKPKPREAWTDSDMCCHCKYHKWIGSMQNYVEKGEPMREKCTLDKPEPICEYTPPISRPPQSWCYVEVER